MRLIRLKITDPKRFRGLQNGFEIYFLREMNLDEAEDFNPYILAGPNGSGKSNLLEALASIFYHLECMNLTYRPDSFEFDEIGNPRGFQSEYAMPDGFELEYLIRPHANFNYLWSSEYAHIKIIKECERPPVIYWPNRDKFDKDKDIVLTRDEIRAVLPDFVIGYSSGENEILSLPFFKMRFIHFDEYNEIIKNENPYPGAPEGRLTFLNNEFNQAILLSNLLLQDEGSLKPFKDEVGIEDIKIFRIIIKEYIKFNSKQSTEYQLNKADYPQSLIQSYEDEYGEIQYKLHITQNVEQVIQKFKSCATCQYYDNDSDELYLDFWVNDQTKEAFKFYFETPIKIFQAFQILLTLNLYTISERLKKDMYQSDSLYVNETIPTLPSDERIMRFKDFLIKKAGVEGNLLLKEFSDGEHQFLHSLGLCLLYKDTKSLFLLDEPDTHFNPDWRAKFISSLRGCIENTSNVDEKTTREMLITTHSPFLISDSKSEYVFVFTNNKETGQVEVVRPEYTTLGASINKITMMTFNKKETIGGYAEKQLNVIKNKFEAGEPGQGLIDEVNELLGDSVEKVLFVKKVLASMEYE